MAIHTSEVIYKQSQSSQEEPINFYGFCAYDDELTNKRPAVIVMHDWSGQNDFARTKAQLLAEMGYVGFAIDLYGNKQEGKTKAEKTALMSPFMENRELLLERLLLALNTVRSLPQVDSTKVAAIGFCFGGLCVLDLARSGQLLSGVISFHGLLSAPANHSPKKIQAKVLVLHGYDDPMVTPDQVVEFANEMKAGQVDWQIHMYGGTQHAFTNPLANDPAFGMVYSPTANHRSWQTADNFLKEIFHT